MIVAPLLAALLGGIPATDTIPPSTTFTLDSRATGEPRVINVYTPPGYERSGERRFPVLYMPDGGVQEDFPHVVMTVDSLIRLGRIPATLVVGVENTERRRDMTGPTSVKSDSAIAPRVGGATAFRSFWRDELIPEIDRRYRTTTDRAIIGESLAGLFIMETMLVEPGLFRRYIALSPSLWWNDDALLRTAPAQARRLPQGTVIYLSMAGEPGIGPQSDTLDAILRAATPRGVRYTYHPRPDLSHGTIYLGESPAALAAVLVDDAAIPVTLQRYTISPDTIVVHLGDTVRVALTALDRDHGFEIPELHLKVKVKRGAPALVEFVPTRVGSFVIRCSVFCGTGHGRMASRLVVLPRSTAGTGP